MNNFNNNNNGSFVPAIINLNTKNSDKLNQKYTTGFTDDFCKIINLIDNKQYLTIKGMEGIIKIKSGMNKGRKSE